MGSEPFVPESTTGIGTPPQPPDLEYTGERIVPGKTLAPLFREHEERYVFAGQYVEARKVLDVACGTGIGTHYLSKAGAACCYGVDIDERAIDYARAAYEGCVFLSGDATDVPLPSKSVDVVVSFETIEHVRDQRKFLEECRRVLRPRGWMICSTPNRAIYRWQGCNPFHVRELTPEEFQHLMASYFQDLELFTQSEQFYPTYMLGQIARRVLDRLGLKQLIKKALPIHAPTTLREFSENGYLPKPLPSYRHSLLVKPTYLVAVARKPGC